MNWKWTFSCKSEQEGYKSYEPKAKSGWQRKLLNLTGGLPLPIYKGSVLSKPEGRRGIVN